MSTSMRNANQKLISPVRGGSTDLDFIYSYSVNADGEMDLDWAIGDLSNSILPETANMKDGGFLAALVDDEDRTLLFERNQDSELGKSRVDEFRITDLDGQKRLIRIVSRSELNSDHTEITRIVGSIQDISFQRSTELSLRSNEAMLRSVFDAADIGVLLYEVDGMTKYRVNQTFCDMLGYTEREMLMLPYSKSNHPEDLEKSLELRKQLLSGKIDHFNIEKRYIHADGHDVWADVTAVPIRDDDGTIINFVSYIRDITKQKEAELREHKSQVRYRALIDSSIQGIIVTNIDHEIIFANSAFVSMFGYDSIEEFMRYTLTTSIVAPHEQERLKNMGASWLAGDAKSYVFEFDGIRKDGRIIKLQSMTNKLDWDGETAFQSAIVDATEQKQIEQDLRLAKDQAEYASRAKTDFLANMSHELRTPLNSIIGFSELMSMDFIKPSHMEQYRSYASDINFSGRHLLQVINDILDVSKIEAGVMNVEHEPVNVEQCIESCIRMMKERAAVGKVSLNTNLSPLLPIAHADDIRVKQVLLNLISNAVKFTSPGGVVDISANDLGDGFIKVIVRDTGAGIPDELMDSMFKPFMQASNAHQLAHEGTGLGLAIVKSFTEMMGGKVGMESTLGEGTAVSVTLPIYQA